MSFLRNSTSLPDLTTSVVHRFGAEITGVREVVDELTGLTIIAGPMAIVKEIILARLVLTATYLLCGPARIYVGESTRIGRRLWEHAADASKAFASEFFIITKTGTPLDKTTTLYLQAYFTGLGEEAGLVTVQKGIGPQLLNLPPEREAFCLKIARIVERLLFDAGCHAFHGNVGVQPAPIPEVMPGPTPAQEAEEDATPLDIGVTTTPAGTAEYWLNYTGLWAHGYAADGGFVVTAGSEVRREINPSVNAILYTRRDELTVAGALAEIPGVDDRFRLRVSVWFPSLAVAAKTITGAHVASNKWVPIENPRPFVLEA